jgi:hypothetical protein
MTDRTTKLQTMSTALNTPAGEELVAELEAAWDPYKLIGATSEETAYLVGLRDAYKFIKHIQKGVFE